MLGGVSLIIQTYLIREFLVVVHGTELSFGLLFACWLFWIGAAAMVGITIARRVQRPAVHLRVWASLGALAPLAQVELVRHGQDLLGVAPGLIVSWQQTLLLAFLAMAPFCVMIGMSFPLGCRVLTEQSSRGVGYLYMVEAAGALAGGVLASFVLVGRVGALAVVAGGAAVLVGVSSLLQLGATRALGFGVAALLLATTPLFQRWDDASRARQVQALIGRQELVAVFDTPYEQVAVARLAEQLTIYGDGLTSASIPDPYGTPGTVYRVLAQAPAPRSVLVLGEPTSGLASAFARALDEHEATRGAELTFVHADEELLRTLEPFLPPEESAVLSLIPERSRRARVNVIVDDPRAFLVRARAQFDLIFVDAPEPAAAHLNRFYTVEFFQAARRALAPRGVLCFNLTSADYVGREVSLLAVSVRKALSRAFARVVVTAGDESWFFAGEADAPLSAEPSVVLARLREHAGARAYRDDIVLDYEPGRVRRLEELLASGSDAVINTDDHPSSYHYGAVVWERYSSELPTATSWLSRAHEWVGGLARWHAVAGVLALVALWLGARLVSRPRAPLIDAGLTVAATGFSSMAFNLVLLVAYQSTCGALYQRLAVMSALLMAGIALGTGVVARRAPELRRPVVSVALVLFATAAFALVLPPVLRALAQWPAWAQQATFALLFMCAGVVLGVGYPANTQALLTRAPGEGSATAGGLIDALDHLGATVGALTVGTVVLPAIGATATLHLLALLTCALGLGWLAQRNAHS